MHDFQRDPRTRARDAGLARLRRTTRVSIVGATALAGAFAGVAAHSSPGHKTRVAAATPTKAATASRRNATKVTTTARASTATPAATQTTTQAPAPVVAAAPPVATTGTS